MPDLEELLAAKRERVNGLPEGRVKQLLLRALPELDVIARLLDTLPEQHPFRDRVEAFGHRVREARDDGTTDKEFEDLISELHACATFARSRAV